MRSGDFCFKKNDVYYNGEEVDDEWCTNMNNGWEEIERESEGKEENP